jgi:hypothetical protein
MNRQTAQQPPMFLAIGYSRTLIRFVVRPQLLKHA